MNDDRKELLDAKHLADAIEESEQEDDIPDIKEIDLYEEYKKLYTTLKDVVKELKLKVKIIEGLNKTIEKRDEKIKYQRNRIKELEKELSRIGG